MRSIKDYIVIILVTLPILLFRVSIIPIRLLGYTVEINIYEDTEN